MVHTRVDGLNGFGLAERQGAADYDDTYYG